MKIFSNWGLSPSRSKSILLPDFTISVYGSSCNAFFNGTHSSSFTLFISWHPVLHLGCQRIERYSKGARMRPKSRTYHELPYTEMVKFGTIIDCLSLSWDLLHELPYREIVKSGTKRLAFPYAECSCSELNRIIRS